MNSQSETMPSGCKEVNELVSKPIPDTLWHYTTFAGFQGIFESKSIWATEYRFLNDREELRHAKRLAEEFVNDEPEYTGFQFPARDLVQKGVSIAFNTGAFHENRLRVMVASFSEVGDQLSQWKGYGGNSTGVSIGLNLQHLRPPQDIGTLVTFAPCVYQEEVKRLLLKAVFAHYRDQLQEWWSEIVDSAMGSIGKSAEPKIGEKIVSEHSQELNKVMFRAQRDLVYDLMRLVPLLKHESFFEEQEWRLVLPSEIIQHPTRHKIEYRPVRDALVPYIAYPLRMQNQDGPIHCNGLILGPGSHPNAEFGVNLFFQKDCITIQPQRSKIPYRPS